MRDGPLLGFVKRVLADAYVRGLQRRRARLEHRGQLHWTIAGDCRGCASCCEAPTIAVGPLVALPVLSRAWLWWQRRVNGFVLVQTLREERAYVFSCTHFDATTRRCDSYDTRPGMCRDYPRMLLEAPDPETFERCGYRVLAKNGAAMLAELRARGVQGEQLVQISKRLKLE